MEDQKIRWEVRRQIAISYACKAGLVAVAVFGFTGLQWLGQQKTAFAEEKEQKWTVSKQVRDEFLEATGSPICDSFALRAKEDATTSVPSIVPKMASAEKALSPSPRATLEQSEKAVAAAVEKGREEDWCVKEVAFVDRNQFIAALQDIAEYRHWAEFREFVSTRYEELQGKIERSPTNEAILRAKFADLLARQEAYTRVSAGAVRKAVATRIGALDRGPFRSEERESDFQEIRKQILDPERDGYILYEILWYSCLTLGVLASSMLIVTILTALPITNWESSWSARIDELLKRGPAVTSRSILPAVLTTTALAGGTLAGAVMATEPGGTARPGNDNLEISKCLDCLCQSGAADAQAAGDEYDIEIQRNEGESLRPLVESIDSLTNATALGLGILSEQNGKTREAVVGKIAGMERAITESVERVAVGVSQRVEEFAPVKSTVKTTNDTLSVAGETLKTARAGIEGLSVDIESHVKQSAQDTSQIRLGQTWQEDAVKRSLAQEARRDPRGFWGRTFGFTLYQTGALALEAMDARLAELGASEEERDVLRRSLTEMRAVPPETRRNYEMRFRAALEKNGLKGHPNDVESIIEKHFGALLRLTALPR